MEHPHKGKYKHTMDPHVEPARRALAYLLISLYN